MERQYVVFSSKYACVELSDIKMWISTKPGIGSIQPVIKIVKIGVRFVYRRQGVASGLLRHLTDTIRRMGHWTHMMVEAIGDHVEFLQVHLLHTFPGAYVRDGNNVLIPLS